MTAEYEITKDDLLAFNLYHYQHSPTARRQYLGLWLVPAFIWLLVCTGIWYLSDRGRGTPLRAFLELLPLFCGAPAYLIVFPWTYRRKLRKMVDSMVGEGRNRGVFGRHRVTISSESVSESGEHGQTSTTWRAVERVAATDERAYIYTNALAAIVVPCRAFADSSQFEEFVRTARGHHENAVA